MKIQEKYDVSEGEGPAEHACVLHPRIRAFQLYVTKETKPPHTMIRYGLCVECTGDLQRGTPGFLKELDNCLSKRLDQTLKIMEQQNKGRKLNG